MPVPLDGFSGVEAVIIPNPAHGAKQNQTIGLAGQKNSPFATPTRIAALTHTGLKIAPDAISDATPGSLGLWKTIVRPPASEQTAKAAPQLAAPQSAATNRRAKVDETEIRHTKRRRSTRTPGLLEQSNKRNSARPKIQTASVNSRFNDDFWMRMSLDSN